MATEQRLLWRPEEVAHQLGVGRNKVFEELASGRLRSVKLGRSRRIPHQALVDFIALIVSEQELTDPVAQMNPVADEGTIAEVIVIDPVPELGHEPL